MKMYPILMALPLFFCSCSSDSTAFNGSHLEPLQPAVHITPALNVDLNTDKALYKPGEKITFTASGTIPAGAKVRYRCGDEVIGTTSLTGNTWTWTAPSMDHTGYLADIYTQDGDSAETVYGTVGVDVSTNWANTLVMVLWLHTMVARLILPSRMRWLF
jgi:dextranase